MQKAGAHICSAESSLGDNQYNPTFNNCEHFATWLIKGENDDGQNTSCDF